LKDGYDEDEMMVFLFFNFLLHPRHNYLFCFEKEKKM